ncbi:hypothetical protein YT1_4617 [Rhodococcus ruber]|nr:hypothetical protein YT1_4617 [Rhodococcus ruber]
MAANPLGFAATVAVRRRSLVKTSARPDTVDPTRTGQGSAG